MNRKYMYIPFNGVSVKFKRVDPVGDVVSAAITVVGVIWTVLLYI